MIDPKDCTIIIPHLGGTKESEYSLDQCLKSLSETIKTEIIVVPNGEKCQITFHWDADLASIHVREQGQCKAVNAAAVTVNTPWIFVTNDDMIYAPGWWERLVNNIEEEKCISPQLVEPRPGAPTFQVQPFGGAGGDFNKEAWLKFAEFYPTVGEMKPGFNLPFLIKKELWDLIGGYDINYDPWGASGDTDLECKIMLAGVQPYQNTNCIVYHFSQTSGTFHPDNHSYWQKNYEYFQQKWGFERAGDPNAWVATDCIKYDELIYKPHWKGFYTRQPIAFRGMRLGETYGD